MTLKELRSLLAKWQPRLRLEDWTIDIRWMTAEERKGENKDDFGECIVQETIKHADIKILNPRYHAPDDNDAGRLDTELTVVHEMLHIHMRPFRTKTGSLLEVAEENLVHAISTLLVAMDRGDASIIGKKLPKAAAIPTVKIIRKASAKKSKVNQTEVTSKAGGSEGSGSEAQTDVQPSAGRSGEDSGAPGQ